MRLLRTRSLKTFWTTQLQPLFKADNRKAQITLVQQIGPQLPQVHKVQCHQHWFGVDLNYCESFAALKNKYLSVLMTIRVFWPPILKNKIQYGCNKKHFIQRQTPKCLWKGILSLSRGESIQQLSSSGISIPIIYGIKVITIKQKTHKKLSDKEKKCGQNHVKM